MSSDRDPADVPPFLGRWRNVYVLLILQLIAVIGIFYAVTRWAS